MIITDPKLQPKTGYVEVELDNGARAYAPTEEMLSRLELDADNKLLKARLQAQTERSEFIDECIAEMATIMYA